MGYFLIFFYFVFDRFMCVNTTQDLCTVLYGATLSRASLFISKQEVYKSDFYFLGKFEV